MREIVVDTETTGLDPLKGDRLVEIAGVELVNHVPTGNSFHRYINPQRDMPEEAFRIHGLSADFLAGHPLFHEVIDDFLEFAGESRLIIHNAAFDMRFINAELARLGRRGVPMDRAVDTLVMAQKRFPGAPNSLDALCRRFGVDSSARVKHGALLDCELLAEVYLNLLGGRQADLGLKVETRRSMVVQVTQRTVRPARPHAASPEELAAHRAFVARLKEPLWDLPEG
ncbi:DNA polymerase III subunit epsilon [Geminicoccaceae bacterium 1502E]|nr:DNA polymerase III subunit epsilon [Geminicoccaceae bacterium 1502E]